MCKTLINFPPELRKKLNGNVLYSSQPRRSTKTQNSEKTSKESNKNPQRHTVSEGQLKEIRLFREEKSGGRSNNHLQKQNDNCKDEADTFISLSKVEK